MEDQKRAEFVTGYTKLLTNAWGDPAFRKTLSEEPGNALAASGLAVPADAKITILSEMEGDGDLDRQVDLWEKGSVSGEYTLFVPMEEASVTTTELAESDLEMVAGGAYYCCCCCPCCSCA